MQHERHLRRIPGEGTRGHWLLGYHEVHATRCRLPFPSAFWPLATAGVAAGCHQPPAATAFLKNASKSASAVGARQCVRRSKRFFDGSSHVFERHGCGRVAAQGLCRFDQHISRVARIPARLDDRLADRANPETDTRLRHVVDPALQRRVARQNQIGHRGRFVKERSEARDERHAG